MSQVQTSKERITFIGIDGEGITSEGNEKKRNEHFYNLLVIRNNEYDLQYEMVPRAGEWELRTEDILKRLSTLRRYGTERGHKFVFVMYYFNYDITMWLKDLPVWIKEKLWKSNTAYVKYGETVFRLHYLPNKIFEIKTKNSRGEWVGPVIYDVFGFFQTSFVRALINWNIASEEELTSLDAMKKARSEFSQYSLKSIINYCGQECGYLCRLMDKVKDAFEAENIHVKGWYGAGAVGQALLDRENMQPIIQSQYYLERRMCDDSLDTAIMSSYFGGRFELMRQGIVAETHQYDINSAYPYAMLSIPDFSQMEIEIAEEYDEGKHPFALWFVTYDVSSQRNVPLFGPLPYRGKSGNVVFPHYNSYGIWVHAIELSTAIKLYGRECFRVHAGYILHPYGRTYYPFSFINEMATRRLALKRKGDKRNIVLKLAMNSLYGKMAQAIGSKDRIPPFQNYYLAGYITAHCRAQVLELAWSCGENGSDVIQFATDGVFSISPSKLVGTKTSETLGEWEYTYHDKSICYLQAGIYFTQGKGKETKRRTRGFAAKRLDAETVFEAWQNLGVGGQINAADTRFIGLGTTVATKRWYEYGTWKIVPHEINLLPPSGKQYLFESRYRIYGLPRQTLGEVADKNNNYYILVPWNDSPKIDDISRPYPHRHQHDLDMRLAELEPEIVEIIQQEIMDFDQPDYERWRGFGDYHPGDYK